MRRTENPENVVRVHECPRHNAGIAQSVERRSPKPKVVGSRACGGKPLRPDGFGFGRGSLSVIRLVDVGADEVFVVDEGVVVAVATASILLAEPGDDVTLSGIFCVLCHYFNP